MKATQIAVFLMQSWTATVTKDLEPSSGSDSEDHLEEGNIIKTGSRPALYSLREAKVLTQDQHIMTILAIAYCLEHNCFMKQIKDVLDLVKLNYPTPNSCETSVDKVKSVLCGKVVRFNPVDFCNICNKTYPKDPDIYKCGTQE